MIPLLARHATLTRSDGTTEAVVVHWPKDESTAYARDDVAIRCGDLLTLDGRTRVVDVVRTEGWHVRHQRLRLVPVVGPCPALKSPSHATSDGEDAL